MATTPYVAPPPVDVGSGGNAEDPTFVDHLADGTCVQDHIAVPQLVPCPIAAPARKAPARASRRPTATTTTTLAPLVYRPTATLVGWHLRAV